MLNQNRSWLTLRLRGTRSCSLPLCCSFISPGGRSLPSPLSEDPTPGSRPVQFWPPPRLSPHLGTSARSFSHSVPLPQLRSRCPAGSCCLLPSYTSSVLQAATRSLPDANCNTAQLPAFAMTSVTPSSPPPPPSSLNSSSSPSGPRHVGPLHPCCLPWLPRTQGQCPSAGGPSQVFSLASAWPRG